MALEPKLSVTDKLDLDTAFVSMTSENEIAQNLPVPAAQTPAAPTAKPTETSPRSILNTLGTAVGKVAASMGIALGISVTAPAPAPAQTPAPKSPAPVVATDAPAPAHTATPQPTAAPSQPFAEISTTPTHKLAPNPVAQTHAPVPGAAPATAQPQPVSFGLGAASVTPVIAPAAVAGIAQPQTPAGTKERVKTATASPSKPEPQKQGGVNGASPVVGGPAQTNNPKGKLQQQAKANPTGPKQNRPTSQDYITSVQAHTPEGSGVQHTKVTHNQYGHTTVVSEIQHPSVPQYKPNRPHHRALANEASKTNPHPQPGGPAKPDIKQAAKQDPKPATKPDAKQGTKLTGIAGPTPGSTGGRIRIFSGPGTGPS